MNTLTAFYDLAVGPVSYDFVVFMMKAELARRDKSCDALHIVVVPFSGGVGGMFRDKTALYDEHEMHWRLWNIVLPACQLIGASVTLATDWAQAMKLAGRDVWPSDWNNQKLERRQHLVDTLIWGSRKGLGHPPLLQASKHARRKVRQWFATFNRPVVTLTQRLTYLGGRNTSAVEWAKFSNYLDVNGYQPVSIADTDTALSIGRGYAELNIDLRLAMYQEAAINFHANSGASSLSWFSDKPYRMLDAGVGDSAKEWEGLFVKQGLPLGETWPWAKPQQKIVYERSTFDVLKREFEEWKLAAGNA